MASACMFCGGKPTTREHVFPAWIKSFLPPTPRGVAVGGDMKNPRWVLPSFDQRAKLVCGPCNHGWMSRLEDRVKPMLGPVIRSPRAPLSLSVDERRIVAKWSVKTALVIQASLMRDRGKGSYIPPGSLNWFKANKENREQYDPPPLTRVWAFLRWPVMPTRHTSLAFAMTFSAAAIRHDSGAPVSDADQPSDPEAHITTFGIGYLGFQVVGQDRPDGKTGVVVSAELAEIIARIMVPIWPTTEPRNRWPPSVIIGVEDLERLGRWGLDPAGSQPVR